uniref:RRM domain-containing protein n=1 Tax=Fundulus heteroclitus TaxID=8078 RepID=A0A3Q2UER3_FUNHE
LKLRTNALISGTFYLPLASFLQRVSGNMVFSPLSTALLLQVRNLMLETTEETLHREFSSFKPGAVERVKKLTDYAFVHYRSRADAIAALGLMNGAQIDGATVEVTLAKPAGIKDAGGAGKRCNARGPMGNAASGGASEGRASYNFDPAKLPIKLSDYHRSIPEMMFSCFD